MSHACRFCGHPLTTTFANLGMSPISNDYVAAERAFAMEPFYPLHAYVCDNCFLVQLIDFERAENMFSDEYAYFSSYSESWLRHAHAYAEATIVRERLGPDSLVVEIASNDGYLLQYFKGAGVPVLGVEPTANTARVALEERGVPSEVAFFGRETAQRLRDRGLQADVMAGNNVMAHVPDINDFVSGYPHPAEEGRGRQRRVPAPTQPDREQPVRHHLPRAFFISVVHRGAEDLRRPTECGCTTRRS